MESARIVAWRYNYLQRLNKLRSEGSQIVFLDETWYDTHDVVRKGWDDGTCNCILKSPSSRGKRIMVLHAGGREGWVPNCLYLSARNIQDSKADSHDEITGEVFENWFKTRLLQNLPRDKKCVIVMDNASYHSREGVENINSNLWSSCVDHTIKVGERYWIQQDTTGDGERFIVDLRESDTDDE
ncbi:hypothetical protein ANN_10640 [Periplaneta americana]|uniref:Tc1-like transposase DDE domain-containing protein n=1 Tax=Periplaneta americana TaxID=6978 RepID=A0ABQ8T409_PERAM|nr:hypothetical protein ANN_10640 [Periplaneta americana]